LISAQAGHVVSVSSEALSILNIGNRSRRTLTPDPVYPFSEPVVSPDNRFAVIPFHVSPFVHFSQPTIVDLENPTKRYYLGRVIYRLDWTPNRGDAAR
jgi:hypothetical protein